MLSIFKKGLGLHFTSFFEQKPMPNNQEKIVIKKYNCRKNMIKTRASIHVYFMHSFYNFKIKKVTHKSLCMLIGFKFYIRLKFM